MLATFPQNHNKDNHFQTYDRSEFTHKIEQRIALVVIPGPFPLGVILEGNFRTVFYSPIIIWIIQGPIGIVDLHSRTMPNVCALLGDIVCSDPHICPIRLVSTGIFYQLYNRIIH